MKYRMTIVQPKNGGIKTWEVDNDWLNEFEEEAKQAIGRTRLLDPVYNPGEKQCKWCRHKVNCEPHLKSAMNAVGIDWAVVDMETDIAQQVANSDPKGMSDEKLRLFVEGIPLLKQAIAAVEEEGIRRFKSGHTVPGLKVVQGQGNRKFKFEEEEMAGKLRRMQIPKDVVWQAKLISPAQLEKAVWTNRAGERKSLTKKQLQRIERDYIERPKTAFRLVPEAAKGEAVDFTADVSAFFASANDIPDFLK